MTPIYALVAWLSLTFDNAGPAPVRLILPNLLTPETRNPKL
jgi:hypothetical protein